MPCLPSSKVYPPDVGSFKTKFMDEASIEYFPEGESDFYRGGIGTADP